MGNDAQKKNQQQRSELVNRTTQMVNNQAFQRSPLEDESRDYFNNLNNQSNQANDQARQDYGQQMGDWRNLYSSISGSKPMSFNWDRVNATRPDELNESFGYLREAMPGYRDFAKTGGYSDTDQQEIRARGMEPIRSAYGGAIRDIDRSRALGGAGGSANYIAARSKAQRELPGQMADAMTGVNANLAEQIRQGKLAGLAGISGIGSTMGGLSSDDANRMLQANLANSQGSLQAAGMTYGAQQDQIANQMKALGGQNSLYGTTPGMASMFGNQAMNAMGMRVGQEQNRNNLGLGLIDANIRALDGQSQNQRRPWWQTALGVAGTAAPYVGMALSDRTKKKAISEPLDTKKVMKGIKKLNLHTWKYKGDDTTHMGPMAQDVKKHLGIGDGKTLHLADIMGVMLATSKSEAMA